ncbi:ESPR-type extended signal peptide-containing protein, partial [Dialister succinatiphilus]|uniref:ESPR-type extended signal peptide-containing protein n=1 Tax=Dialister succinatiphilus TaxID=487173 RepID=UPI0040283137
MNKIYKVMYSKVKQCAVVVSEIAKSHGHNEGRSAVRKHTALTAAVLIALGTFTFMGTPAAQAGDSLKNNDFVGANSTYWYWDIKKNTWTTYDYKLGDAFNNRSWTDLPNYNGAGAKLPGSIAAGLYAQAGQETITIGDRNAGQSRGSVFIGEQGKYNDGGDNNPSEKSMQNNYVTAVGFQSDATGWGSIAIGSNAVAENTKKTDTTVNEVGKIGNPKTVSDDVYGIESNPSIKGASVALGYNAHAKDGNIAIGAYSDATDTTTSTTPYVSVGNSNLKRRITNVADGDAATDVATVGQLQDLEKKTIAYNEGWGIKIGDYTKKDAAGNETTVKNAISVDRNLGNNSTSVTQVSNTGLILGGDFRPDERYGNYGATGQYAVTLGGRSNRASGESSVAAGGMDNTADGNQAFVGGGYRNIASGDRSSAIGGVQNTASGPLSSAIGGDQNTASGDYSSAIAGYQNTANGFQSSAIGGWRNIASGWQSSAFGGSDNISLGMRSSTLGGTNSVVLGNFATGIAGGSTGSSADNSLAAGSNSVVTVDNGIAIGYQATTNERGTIAFGHDKDDISGYTVTWKQKATSTGGKYYNAKGVEITKDQYEALRNPDYTFNDYSKDPEINEDKYKTAAYNRLVKVADGKDAHDAVVMEQLKPYTKSDASNIGNNLKTYTVGDNGETITEADATDDQKKTNKDNWGKALGAEKFTAGTTTTATNASTSDQLVTGKTLYNYDAPVAETGKNLNYVSANNTTGQNLSALDAQVADNASKLNDKTHNIKYYSVNDKKSSTQETLPTVKGLLADNSDNKGAKGMGSLASGFSTEADGIASTVAGSYSGVINQNGNSGLDFRGAAALSYGTFNVNQNTADTAATKTYSGVANSIVGQANMTTDSNAAIIYGAGNTVTNSYRPIDPKKAGAILDNVSNPTNLGKAMQDAVKDSGGQVMVMGGGNNVESAYMSQVVGVGNTVKGNQVKNTEGEWATDTSDTAIKDYDSEKSSQYNYVDGFNNEVINGKHDYIIGANNKLDGDSYDDNNAKPIKRSNKSNVVIGDNHALTGKKNNVIIGSADTEGTLTRASDAVIIGHNANATSDTGADNAVAIGLSATAGGGNAVTIGVNTSAGDNSITIGSESSAISGSNIAIGRYARVYGDKVTNAVALGHNANAKVADGVAIGSGSEATVTGKSTEGYDPTTGKNSTETTSTWQATNAAVSIGTVDGKVTRQINGVAAGTNETDAVNVAQLKNATAGMTTKGLNFQGNNTDVTV